MFYIGFCRFCNFLDADLNGNDIEETILDHQLEKHPEIFGKTDSEYYGVIRILLPFSWWLQAKLSPKFWEVWRNRNNPSLLMMIKASR